MCLQLLLHQITFNPFFWAKIAQLVVCSVHCPAWCSVVGLILLCEEFFRRGDFFPVELTWVLTPFPLNSLRWENKQRSSLCTHAFHGTESKDLDIHILDRWMQNTPSTYHPQRWNAATSMVGLHNGHKCKNIAQNGEPQRYSWGTQKKKFFF